MYNHHDTRYMQLYVPLAMHKSHSHNAPLTFDSRDPSAHDRDS